MGYWQNPFDKAAFEHSRMLTAQYSKSFSISARMLPRERRWAAYALYGFCRYADNLIDIPRERSPEELVEEADMLRREIEIAYRTGESEHPIVRPFIIVAHRFEIPMHYPLELLKGVQMDISMNRYDTFDDLYLFCYRVAGVVGLMMTHILGYKDKAAFQHAEELGIAMQLTNILRDVKEDKDMGRIYVPQEDLLRYGVSEQDIYEESMTPKMLRLMKFQVERAHDYYERANVGIPMLERKSQFAIFSASKIYRSILTKLEAREYNPFLGRVFLPQINKVGILLHEIVRTRLPEFPERYVDVSPVE